MILSDIKKYLVEHKHVELKDLAYHFDSDPEAMKGMLEQWIHKGKLRKITEQKSCKSCCNCCGSESAEIYEWTG